MGNFYRYVTKGGLGERINSVAATSYATSDYGAVLSQSYPLTASISTFYFPSTSNASGSQYALKDTSRRKIHALKNTIDRYKIYSQYYNSVTFLSSGVDATLVNIPSIFFGDSIKKGSVKLSIFSDGELLSKVEDVGKNGELIKTTGSTNLFDSRNVAGVVLYDEGIILLSDNKPLTNYTESFFQTTTSGTDGDYARWNTWGISANTYPNAVVRTSYDIEFEGVHKIPQLVMLAHAKKGELNHSNNISYLERATVVSSSSALLLTRHPYIFSTSSYFENPNLTIKNIVKNEYITPTASFHKETYITKILIYDENKNVIAVAKTSKPIRKTEERDFTFKLKLDL